MMPFVSVIIPTHNRAELLIRALRSVLEQTYSELECIVIDDESTDETQRVVQELADERLVYVRHETNRGASAARNTGIARAKGSLIAFLDDDDEWLPTKLEKQVTLISGAPSQVGMVYCWMDYYDNDGRVWRAHHPELRGAVFPHVLDQQRLGGCPTLVVRCHVIDDVGGFDEKLPRANDADFIQRVCLHYEVDFVPEVLVRVYTEHGYPRISQSDEQGLRNDIIAETAKLAKFRDVLPQYPRQTALIYSVIAVKHSQLGEWSTALSFYWRAFLTFPFLPRIYVRFLRNLF